MSSFSLYLITDPELADPIASTRQALSAAPPGAIAVQARWPGARARALIELSSALLPICRAASAPLIVNDRADVARVIGADGVQLPEAGLTVAQARAVLGPRAIVGRSCHDRGGLVAAARDGADFATLGPIGAVAGKGPPIGVDGFADAIEGIALPVYALGGVDARSRRALIAAGARGLAVVRAIYGAEDVGGATRSLLGV